MGFEAMQPLHTALCEPATGSNGTDAIYNESYFDGSGKFGNREELGGYLSTATGYATRARLMAGWLTGLTGLPRGSRWLDVGCGPGYLVQAAASEGMIARSTGNVVPASCPAASR